MLKKLDELKISKDEPFKDDALDRQTAVQNLTKLIESTSQSFVLSVEAPWGWGKSTFIGMCRAHMESRGHTCLLFNAWQNDFTDDPLVAFIGEMSTQIEEVISGSKNATNAEKYLRRVKKLGAGVLRKSVPLVVKLATHGLLSQEAVAGAVKTLAEESDEISEFASEIAKKRLEDYESERKGISSFRSSLENLANAHSNRGDEKRSKENAFPLVFFVDEMDRCRPDFAISLLERIKHLFNVPKVVFVLAVDRAQLNESVKAIYGLGSNPDGYLRRFIDLSYILPAPSTDSFVQSLYGRFALHEVVESRNAEVWTKAFAICAKAFKLSLRAQEQCFIEMNIVWRATRGHANIYPAALAIYCALRAYRYGIFDELRKKPAGIDEIMQLFNISESTEPVYKVWFELALIHGFCDDRKERQDRLAKCKNQFAKEEIQNIYLNRARAVALDLSQEGYRTVHLNLLAKFDMASQFR